MSIYPARHFERLMASSKIALIFDFDDTLTDDSTSALLSSLGVDIKAFWKEANRLVTDELWDPTLAYLHLILRNIEQGKIPALTNARLRAFGKTLKPYPGLKDFLKDLRSCLLYTSRRQHFAIIALDV